MSTYQVSDVTVLFEFHSGELSHIGSGGGVWYVVCAANNISPEGDHFLPLYELDDIVRPTPIAAAS